MTVEQLFRSRAGHLLRHAILLRSQCFQKHVLCIVVSEAHNIVHTACQPHYRLDAFRLAWGLLETCDDRKEVLAIRLFAIHTTLNGPNTISWDHSNASLSSWITWSRYADIRSLGFFGRSQVIHDTFTMPPGNCRVLVATSGQYGVWSSLKNRTQGNIYGR